MLMAEVLMYCPGRPGGKTVTYYGEPRPSRTMARDMTDAGWSLEDASGPWMVWLAESAPGRMPMVCAVFYFRPVSLEKDPRESYRRAFYHRVRQDDRTDVA